MPGDQLFRIRGSSHSKESQAKQFVVIRVDEVGERIPLTIAGWGTERDDNPVVADEVTGKTTKDRMWVGGLQLP